MNKTKPIAINKKNTMQDIYKARANENNRGSINFYSRGLDLLQDGFFKILLSGRYINVAYASESHWEGLKESINPAIKDLAKARVEKKSVSFWEIAKVRCELLAKANINEGNDKSMLITDGCLSHQCINNFSANKKQDGENNFFIQGQSATCSGNVIMSDLKQLIDPEGHSDGSQPIPGKARTNTVDTEKRGYAGIELKSQFLGYLAGDVSYKNYTIIAPKIPMHGIFSSDGGYRRFSVTDCIIDTRAIPSRKLAIAGVMNVGNVQRNIDPDGKTIKLYLYPLRIGGGQANINIMSFKNDIANKQAGYFYNKNIPVASQANIEDLRFTPRPGGLNLYNFDMKGFLKAIERKYYERIDKEESISSIMHWLKTEALKYGTQTP
ncbi:MAG: hypothetical protein CR991_10795 [Proteobacteria bacterium]|nr:MAG: hypothetical protein CR991_10795 [Pseudomonadota bacterium]